MLTSPRTTGKNICNKEKNKKKEIFCVKSSTRSREARKKQKEERGGEGR